MKNMFKNVFHCEKIVQIRSFFCFVFSCIWPEYWPEKTPYSDTFLEKQLTFNWSKSTIKTLKRRRQLCSKLTIKTVKWYHRLYSGVFIVFDISFSNISIVNFEQVNVKWVLTKKKYLAKDLWWNFLRKNRPCRQLHVQN